MDAELNVDSILGQDGRISHRLDRYEERPQQLAMAREVKQVLDASRHLVVEAGTGTGKSFAYLVPAILHATSSQVTQSDRRSSSDPVTRQGESDSTSPSASDGAGGASAGGPTGESVSANRPRRVLISTNTISLQEQLVQKDIPLLNSVIPREFSAVLVKGRGNYVSLRRLERALSKAVSLFDRDEAHDQLRQIRKWSANTPDGSLSSLPIRPDPAVWDEVASDSGNCLGKSCPHHKECFYFRARRRASHAQLLIVNHAMFFSDLALRRQDVSILPDYDAVILDECHTVESVAGDHLGIRMSSGQFQYLFNRLYNDSTQKGILVTHELQGLQKQVNQCRFAADTLFSDLLSWWEKSGPENGRVRNAAVVENSLSEPMEQLARGLQRQADARDDASDRKDFESARDRLLALSGQLRQWLGQEVEDSVYWLEKSGSRRGMDRVSLCATPLDVGSVLREELFQNEMIESVVMTSATLATGEDDRFGFFRSRIGLEGGRSLRVDSPFDYQRQSKIVVVKDLPDPSRQRQQFEAALPEQVKRFAGHTNGHAFVLFTSYDLLRRVASAVSPWLSSRGLQLYSQAGQQNRTQLLNAFRRNPRGVLFGTDSFWQGVDVPGEALSNVIITKLPFAVPNHPLLEARLDAIRSTGGNPFRDYQLPEAVIKFRQGVGRLIRTADDKGMVVILDPRIHTKHYGRQFLQSLPEQQVIHTTARPNPVEGQ